MAIVVKLFGLTQEKVVEQAGAAVDLLATAVTMSLHTNTYVPDRDVHDFQSDATNELAVANGYARQTLGTKAITYDTASDEVRFDCADITFPFSAAQTWRHGVVAVNTAGADTTDPLYGLLTWDSDQTVSTSYTLTIDVAGLFFWDTT